jgi:hypothetical protein
VAGLRNTTGFNIVLSSSTRVSQMKPLKVETGWGPPVCSCRHRKSSAWVRSRYCVWYIWDCAEKWQSCTETVCTKLAGKNFSGFSFDSFPCTRSAVLLVVSTVFWDVTPCRLIERYDTAWCCISEYCNNCRDLLWLGEAPGYRHVGLSILWEHCPLKEWHIGVTDM